MILDVCADRLFRSRKVSNRTLAKARSIIIIFTMRLNVNFLRNSDMADVCPRSRDPRTAVQLLFICWIQILFGMVTNIAYGRA